MNRLEQQAADALAWHERQAAFRASERVRWARAQAGAVITGTVRYERAPEDARQLAQEIKAGLLPF